MRQVMSKFAVAEHYACSPRKARGIMDEIGCFKVGNTCYVYADALEAYEAKKVEHTEYTLPILQKDYPTKNPRYTRERNAK